MQVKRFVAADMRRALEMVRQELGPDAIILSSNRVKEGVELLTTLAEDSPLREQQQPLAQAAMSTASPMLSDGAWAQRDQDIAERAALELAEAVTRRTGIGQASGKTGQQLADEIEQARLRMLASRQAEESAREHLLARNATRTSPARSEPSRFQSAAERYGLLVEEAPQQAVRPAPAPAAAKVPEPQPAREVITELQAELADMRILLEQQLSKLSGRPQPELSASANVVRRLERLGLPTQLVSRVVSRCKKRRLAELWPEALARLAHQLPVCGRDIVDEGGIFAFVGPTGSGKTTTIGKLAARYVLKHGAKGVALVTMDTFRIAAHDQLRAFARILQIPVKVVDAKQSLGQVLAELSSYKLVLIDTAGFRHGDPQLKQQLQALAQFKQIQNLLVLSCNSQAQMLKASVHAYGPAGLKACVLTKLDETASLGEALGVTLEAQLPMAYVTDGQEVPKHLDLARGHQLVSRALALLKSQGAAAALS